MGQLLKQIVPKPIKNAGRSLYDFLNVRISLLKHSFDVKFKQKNSMIPPDALVFVGNGNFTEVGAEFLRHFINIGRLKPDDDVLDVGCGIGRMAIPLTHFLSKDGSYEGFDIVPVGIKWCRDRITAKHQNFNFLLADIHNNTYHPPGKYKAAEYVFPYRDNKFDFVFLTSVFTHLLPADMENYLSEISRVLKNGGTCFITYFLLNDESRKQIKAGLSTLDFRFEIDGCLTIDKESPEAAIAFDEQFVRHLFDKYDLKLREPIHHGTWCGRKDGLTYQDVIVAEKS